MNNEHGSSFADEGGALPSVSVPESLASLAQGGSGMALKAEVTNTVASASGITINKLVSVDGVNWYGNEALLVAQKGAPVYYRVTVTNNGGRAITDLRILDVLPYDGDGRSEWGPTLTGAVSSDVAETTIYYTEDRPSESAATFTNDIFTNTSAEGANAFLNYLMRPEVAATIQPWTMYLNVNAAAAELLPEGSLDYAALNIPEDLFATKQFAEDLGDYESVYQEIWSEFKLS